MSNLKHGSSSRIPAVAGINSSEVFDATWRMPGAYTSKPLSHVDPILQGREPRIELDHIRETAALEAALRYPYEAAFIPLSGTFDAVMLCLAVTDESGASIGRIERTMIDLHAQALEGVRRAQSESLSKTFDAIRALPDVNTAVFATTPIVRAQRSEHQETVGQAALVAPDMNSAAFAIRSEMRGEVQSEVQLIERAFLECAALAFAHGAIQSRVGEGIRSAPEDCRSLMRRKSSLLEMAMKTLSERCEGNVRARGVDAGTARISLAKCSQVQRVREWDSAISALEHGLSSAMEAIRVASKDRFFLLPSVVVASSLRSLAGEQDRAVVDAASPADESALARHSFLVLNRTGLSIGGLRYDKHWGILIQEKPQRLTHLYTDAMRGIQQGKDYPAVYLMQFINQFPVYSDEARRQIAAAIATKDFVQYLSNYRNWQGEVIKRVKPWHPVQGDKDAKPTVMFTLCEKIYAPLRDGGGYHGDIRGLGIFSSSLLLNAQGEEVLSKLVKAALKQGVPLKDAAIREKQQGGDVLEGLYRDSLNPNVYRLLRTNDDGAIQLTDFGTDYVLELVNNSNPYYETGDDSIEYQEACASRRPY